MLLISEIKLNIDEDEALLGKLIAKKLKCSKDDFSYRIIRKSLDARRELLFVYSLTVDIKNEEKYLHIKNVTKYGEPDLSVKPVITDIRPIIIGYGPSGIFSAVRLLEAGIKPIIFEKGKRIPERKKDIDNYFNNGIFNPDSNVQYGEGGAGTFSDAKLTTRVKNPFIKYITDTFIRFGADPSIAYVAHPHVGTDRIMDVITKLTDYLIDNGAEFHFEEPVRKLEIKDNKVKAVITDKNTYPSDIVILASGHSSYELIKELYEEGVYIEKKDMAVGFRVEHPQSLIDSVQYKNKKHPKLEPSEYFLRYNGDKGVYSFCMCPGGYVIPSNSKCNTIVTNGMSYHNRDNTLANSAILIQVNKEEFSDNPLGGFDYLHNLESKAYEISGSYKALSQNISDYLDNKVSKLKFESSYPLGTTVTDFNSFFNEKDNEIFKEAINYFETCIPGFKDGIMVGPETRSSSPVRITRNENLESLSTKGLYPTGEGSGYGGGIMSCALDGIRTANIIIEKLRSISV